MPLLETDLSVFEWLTRHMTWGLLLSLELFALASVPSVLLRRRGRPSSAIAWLLALFTLPALGGICWWFIGRTRIEKKKRKRAQKKRSYIARHGAPSSVWGTIFSRSLPPRAQGDSVFNSSHNQVTLLTEGTDAFHLLEHEIERASRSVHLLYYIYQADETGWRFARLLAQKAREGVSVRLLLDAFGSQKQTRKLRRFLKEAGVEVGLFLPARFQPFRRPRINFVNHRKIAVIDGHIAFTGGMNIGAEYEHSWHDLMLQIRGPAVSALNHIFLEDWYFATNEAIFDEERDLPSRNLSGIELSVIASGPDSEPWIHDAYFLAITRAEERLYLVTPYFIPTPPILTALRTAAGRGVDVRIILPQRSDVWLVQWAARSYYNQLIHAGVRIFEFQGTMLHAKALVADRDLSSVGTANIDSRSFALSFEVSCFYASPEHTEQLVLWMEELLQHSCEITMEQLEQKPTLQKLGESAAHLFSPIL